MDVELATTTGNGTLDTALRRCVSSLVAAFPARIRSIYLMGSYAYHQARPASDVDLVVVFSGRVQEEEEREAHALVARSATLTAFDLGALVTDDEQLGENEREGGAPFFPVPTIVLASSLLYGDDRRAAYRLLPASQWGRHSMRLRYLVSGVDRDLALMRLPLPAPDPHDEFGGYLTLPVTGKRSPAADSTRTMLSRAAWFATALVALDAGVYVVRKVDAASSYTRLIADQWAPFLSDLVTTCRDRWQYEVPTAAADRAHLRELCAQHGRFENYCLERCCAIFRTDLEQSASPEAQWTMETLERLPLAAPAVILVLKGLANTQLPLSPRATALLARISG